ncbi:primosomal protein N' [Prosthecochloris sp. N3]|uniref:Replication restart protein PriA n=1 Tax=Prosthecochloris ethylica TaxID=2743976 RepID=A0ABR9XTH1_9CHLB|nr:primosomal protein N' [Prosthecochloris ethylica]MBF0586961.1 primosomal protein N' [Prosthecochloris ethylica]MBF0637162.1 primosomal protein N' [Prosthecochloris ethylica]NUK48170.1 primosomal protein N' [Prosthecochloris ethylica]
MYALLYVDRYLRDTPLTATVPKALATELRSGCQVVFSPASNRRKNVLAYVESIQAEPDPESSPEGSVVDILNRGIPVLTPVTMGLALWISDYYMTRPIEAINALLPAPLKTTVQDIVEVPAFMLRTLDRRIISTQLRRDILSLLQKQKKLSVRQLERRLGKKNLYRTLAVMERGGFVELKKKFSSSAPKTRTAYRPAASVDPEDVRRALARAPRQLEAFNRLLEAPEGHLFAGGQQLSHQALNALAEKGYAEKITVELQSSYSTGFSEPPKIIARLTESQQQVLFAVRNAFRHGSFRTFLLHGVTGSGKTMVYIELLKEVLEAGRNAIVLVPEISLTPQTASRFRQHFGDRIQILHSAMSSREKYEAWQRLRNGEARIALGARSTVFAPLENVGAIIVDEEHDPAYKQDRTPRYNGRDVAVMRAKQEQAVCVLGSATPSFESYHNAEQQKYTLLELPERVDHAEMPVIRLVPMRENRRLTPSLSEVLYLQIKQRLERDEQVILLQNRRGFAGSVLCGECAHIPLCPHCHIPMVYHARHSQLRCHYCGHAALFSKTCPTCGSNDLIYRSSGTERIAEELGELFPGERILRMDVDTTSARGAHAMILKEFHDKQARILLGTQMVAKGLDFPDVSLVGVLMADIGMNMPDFRASERLFSLLMQVAGRAGRASIPGEVYIQAYNTDNPLLAHVLGGCYKSFYRQEMEARRDLHYPPFSRLIALEFTSPEERGAERSADEFIGMLERHIPTEACTLLGPAPAGRARLKDRYRYQVLIKLTTHRLSSGLLKQLQYELMRRWQHQQLSVTIDVDPQNLM